MTAAVEHAIPAYEPDGLVREDHDLEQLRQALGDTYGLARVRRCLALAPSNREARWLIRKRVRQDFASIYGFTERSLGAYRATTVFAGRALAALMLACGVWLAMSAPWLPTAARIALVFAPAAAIQSATAWVRWTPRAIIRRQVRQTAKLTHTVLTHGTVHSADYRDHKAVDRDAMGNAAQRQEVVRRRRTKLPKVLTCRRNGNGWDGMIDGVDGMSAAYMADWAAHLAAGYWHAFHLVPFTVGDQSRAKFTIVRRDPLRGEPIVVDTAELLTPVNGWNPVRVARDQLSRWVRWVLAYRRILIGGVPDSGKSTLANVILATMARDPRVPLFLIDPSGVDMAAYEQCTDRNSGFGDYTRAKKASEVMRVMRAARAELARRESWLQSIYDTLGVVKDKIEPGDKLDPTGVGGPEWAPALFLMDEWARLRGSLKGNDLRDFDEIHFQLLSNGRKCAFCVVTLTQVPRHDSIPVRNRDMHDIRVAHRLSGNSQSDMILGDGTAEFDQRSAFVELAGSPAGVALSRDRDGFNTFRGVRLTPEQIAAVARYAADLRRRYRQQPDPSEPKSATVPAAPEPPGGTAGDGCGVVGGGSGVPGKLSGGVRVGQGFGAVAGSGGGSGGGVGGGGTGSEGSGRVFAVGSDGAVGEAGRVGVGDGGGGAGGGVDGVDGVGGVGDGAGGDGGGGGPVGGGRRPGGRARRVRRGGDGGA